MSKFFSKRVFCTSAAIFSMFFGAGNSVFPIELGVKANDQLFFALIGLLITGIGGPLLGLLTALRYRGDSKLFFSSWNSLLGIFFLILSLTLLGPFCVLPRCFIVAYSSFASFIPHFESFYFFNAFALLSLLCTYKKGVLLSLLGYVLSPLLMISLISIIVCAVLYADPALLENGEVASGAFVSGITTGYDTMDLLASVIFSGSIWSLLEQRSKNEKEIFAIAWRSSILGGGFLGLIYCGLAFSASLFSQKLHNIPAENLLSTLALISLGPQLAKIAKIAIFLACLTTVVSLTYAVARIIRSELLSTRLSKVFSERSIIHLILFITVFFANVGFSAIQLVLHPLLLIVYPAIILLTIYNLLRCVVNCENPLSKANYKPMRESS